MSRWRTTLIVLLLAGATLALYWPARHFQFVDYDDNILVTDNEVVKSGLNWASVRWALTTPVVAIWHPVTTLSHMLDCQLFGVNAGPQHLVNVFLHVANTLLLFLALRRLTGATWRSALVAAIFALHPLRVESVAWISERKDVLSGFFFMLTLWAWGRWVTSGESRVAQTSESAVSQVSNLQRAGVSERLTGTEAKPTGSRRYGRPGGLRYNSLAPVSPRVWYVLALLFFTLGLMSKPMLVTLPFVLLLLDYWPRGRMRTSECGAGSADTRARSANWSTLVWEKWPFFALSALFSYLTLHFQHTGTAIVSMERVSLNERLGNAVVSYLRYLGKFFWPTDLAVIYPHPSNPFPLADRWETWQVWVGALALLAITAWCWLRRSQKPTSNKLGSAPAPYLVVGWLWFLGMLVPVIGLVQVGSQAMADRYTYLPLIGVTIAIVWGIADLLNPITEIGTNVEEQAAKSAVGDMPGRLGLGISAPLRSLLAAGTLLACAAFSHRQLGYWHDTIRLFEHAIAVTADNPEAHFGLGIGLQKAGEAKKAMTEYRVALRIDPTLAQAHYNLAQLLRQEGKLENAAREYEAVLRVFPNHYLARFNLGGVYWLLGRRPEAIAQMEEAIRSDPASAEAHNNLAWWLATGPDPQYRNGTRAVELAERACELTAFKRPLMIGTLAATYAEAGRFNDAVSTAERARQAAEAVGQTDIAAKNEELAEWYRAGKAFHESSN